MSFTKDESYGRIRVRFLCETILGHAIFASGLNFGLLGPFLLARPLFTGKRDIDNLEFDFEVNKV